MKRIVSMLLMACLLMSMSVTALALDIPEATEAGGLSLSAETVAVGDEVNIILAASEPLATVQTVLTYDPACLEYVSISPASGDESFTGLMVANNNADNGQLSFAYVGGKGDNTIEAITVTMKVIGWAAEGTEISLVTDGSEALILDALSEGGEIAATYTPETPSVTLRMYLVGDVNGDGKVNIIDVSRLYAHIKGTSLLTEAALLRADVTGDGKVNIIDVSRLYAHVKGTNLLW